MVYWKTKGDQIELASRYIAFWIQPGLFKEIALKSGNARVRKATIKENFGWSIAYNQKLGLNYVPEFDNATPKDAGIGGFVNANYSTTARIGMLPEYTVRSFKEPLLLSVQFYKEMPVVSEWIVRCLDRY